MTTPEIEELKSLIEQKYGKSLSTTTDFEEFCLHFKKITGKSVSPSTLKRMYGYVNDEHKMRVSTLDLLVRYIGHNDYKSYVFWLKNSTRYNSSFFLADQLTSGELSVGSEVVIGWAPNHMLTLVYVGDSTYEVAMSENSKLHHGDRFVTGCFIKGQPLFLPWVERNGEHTAPFVAGRNGGLTVLNVKQK